MAKETGTLAELDVKAGDLVECVGWSDDNSDFLVGEQYTIMEKHPEGYYDSLCAVREGGWNGVDDKDSKMLFRVVSRASATPKTWGEMTDEEQGALLLADHRGEVVEVWGGNGWWSPCSVGRYQGSAYRVRPPEPKRETVTLYGGSERTGYFAASAGGKLDNDTHRITFDVIDGKPDCASIRMEEL